MDNWTDRNEPTLEMLNYWQWIGADNLYWADRDFEDLEKENEHAKLLQPTRDV